jgi:hypothetical protein
MRSSLYIDLWQPCVTCVDGYDQKGAAGTFLYNLNRIAIAKRESYGFAARNSTE